MAKDALGICLEDYEPYATKKLPTPSSLADVKAFSEKEMGNEDTFDSSTEITYHLIDSSEVIIGGEPYDESDECCHTTQYFGQ